MTDLTQLCSLLRSRRLRFGTEADMQADIEQLLTDEQIAFERERQLGVRGRIEFYLPESRVGIECKVMGSVGAVAEQLLRYAVSDEIGALLLVTKRRQHRDLDGELWGKPLRVIWIGGSGL